MSALKAVLRLDEGGVMRPRAKAASFPELSRALRQYLAICATMYRTSWSKRTTRYRSSEELVLFNCAPVWASLAEMTLPQMAAKQCFTNAATVAGRRPEFRYCEGFALMDGSIPTHHAWLTGPEGRIEDPTWPELYRRHAEREPAKAWSGRVVYMGVTVAPEAHLRWILKTGYPNVLVFDERDNAEALDLGLEAFQ